MAAPVFTQTTDGFEVSGLQINQLVDQKFTSSDEQITLVCSSSDLQGTEQISVANMGHNPSIPTVASITPGNSIQLQITGDNLGVPGKYNYAVNLQLQNAALSDSRTVNCTY